jgi:hypothetical protein
VPAGALIAIGHGEDQPAGLRDFLWSSDLAPVLIRQRVADLLASEGFRGWTTYRVDLRGARNEAIDGYLALGVTGRAAEIDPALSEAVVRGWPAGGGAPDYLLGEYFAPESWDGSDFFLTGDRGFASVCVTERVKHAVTSARSRNVTFQRLSEIEWQPVDWFL